ncbi:hypothetical protein [Streptomyces sp. NPDC094468]|uniref:hypothetical protein n=1 Tax=Streptomyces sp. NPDC094468 TaxID=3366066 RepID=UPI0038130D58
MRIDVTARDGHRGRRTHLRAPRTVQRAPRTAHLLTPADEIPLPVSRWATTVHDDAARAAHLTPPAWTLRTIPDHERGNRPHEYWDTALSSPFPAGRTTRRVR